VAGEVNGTANLKFGVLDVSIISLLNQIKTGEVVLPAIQRDFVWPEGKVLRLLDSLMRGYPIGIALLWETYLDLQYREFDKTFQSGCLHHFKEKRRRKKLKLCWTASSASSRFSPRPSSPAARGGRGRG
jgi:hypothetical protein